MKVLWKVLHDHSDYRVLLDVLGESPLRVERCFFDLMGCPKWLEISEQVEMVDFIIALSLRNVTDELKGRREGDEKALRLLEAFEDENLVECAACGVPSTTKILWITDSGYGRYCKLCAGEKWNKGEP